MKRTVITCDRCGKEFNIFDDFDVPIIEDAYGIFRHRFGVTDGAMDLCIECQEKLKEWFENGTEGM